jgi:hypothetical protein
MVAAEREAVAGVQPAVICQTAFFTFTNLQHDELRFFDCFQGCFQPMCDNFEG